MAGTSPAALAWARTAAVSIRTGSNTGSTAATATSSSRNPCSAGIARNPARSIRDKSVRPKCPVIPERCSHIPHASDTPGKPNSRRCTANASRNAFAAA